MALNSAAPDATRQWLVLPAAVQYGRMEKSLLWERAEAAYQREAEEAELLHRKLPFAATALFAMYGAVFFLTEAKYAAAISKADVFVYFVCAALTVVGLAISTVSLALATLASDYDVLSKPEDMRRFHTEWRSKHKADNAGASVEECEKIADEKLYADLLDKLIRHASTNFETNRKRHKLYSAALRFSIYSLIPLALLAGMRLLILVQEVSK